MLSNIRIVLVNPTHPGNIGAAARAMKNAGLEQLYLVAPRIFPSAQATARAAGADDILANARICASLDSALAGCALVLGASARQRSIAWPCLGPRDCARRVISDSSTHPTAIVFGREHSGLSNTELDRCHYLVRIPTNPAFPSLNIAAAVQIIAHELLVASGAPLEPGGRGDATPLADSAEMERFYEHLERVLVEIEFLQPANPRQLMRRLRRLFNRARPDKNEINILRGMLSAIQSHKTHRRK